MSGELDTTAAGGVHWLELKMRELLAVHDKKCAERVKALDEKMVTLSREADLVRGDLSQALAERDEARTAAQVQAAQIAALKVDLAATMKERDEALTDLSQARAELDKDRDKYKALLGRAVAALQNSTLHNQWFQLSANDAVDAILTDPTATAAADAYREEQEERAAAEAVADWFKANGHVGLGGLMPRLVAAIDARRGGGRS